MSISEKKDSAAAEAPFAHLNRVTQQGFTQIPNAVLLRGDIGPVAKLVYGYLKTLAWRNGREPNPPREMVAEDLNMPLKAVTAAIRELQSAPVFEGGEKGVPTLVVAKRKGQGNPNVYRINDPVDGPDSVPTRKDDTAFLDGLDQPFPARARQGSTAKIEAVEGQPPPSPSPEGPPTAPPKLAKVEGRDLALDALCAALSIDPASPQVRQAVVAMNGRRQPATPGIRALFWIECERRADSTGRHAELAELHASGENFERILADRVERKVKAIREKQPWRSHIAPSTVCDLWLDIEAQAGPPTGGYSADELRRLRESE